MTFSNYALDNGRESLPSERYRKRKLFIRTRVMWSKFNETFIIVLVATTYRVICSLLAIPYFGRINYFVLFKYKLRNVILLLYYEWIARVRSPELVLRCSSDHESITWPGRVYLAVLSLLRLKLFKFNIMCRVSSGPLFMRKDITPATTQYYEDLALRILHHQGSPSLFYPPNFPHSLSPFPSGITPFFKIIELPQGMYHYFVHIVHL